MRNSFKVMAAALALGASALAAPAANANPISFYYSTNGTTFTQFGSTNDGSNVALFTAPGISITATGTGSPILAAPNFQTSSVNVLASASGTYYVMAVETGLSTPNITGFNLGFTSNAGSNVTITESFGLLLGASTTPTVISSAILAPNTATTASVTYTGLPATYGVAEIYQATFTGGGTANATISESGIPEPMSMSILGAGLAGLGVIRLRRKAR